MTDFLLRLFVKDYRNTKDTKVRTCYGKLSGIVGIICNAVLFLGKLAAGSLSGSVSITADAFNNLSDASSSIISLFGFRLSERPPGIKNIRMVMVDTNISPVLLSRHL